jgi:NAD-dependent dihydropyrimidine dehydrogenase PreA subunit
MSKNWYPVIDYTLCTECGNCTDMCEHGVYDKEKAPMPKVIFPDGCVEGCRGCGNICPSDAISYIGEQLIDDCGCGCSCGDIDDSEEGEEECCR